MVGDDGVPHPRAGAGVERRQAGVGGGEEQLVAVDREVAAHARVAGRRHLHRVLPDEVAGGRVERLHHRADARDVHNAVVDDRRRRVPAALVHRPHPGQLQLPDVGPIDLREGAVAPRLVVAPDHQPVAVVRVPQHRVGDRPVVGDRPRQGDAARRRRRGRGRPRRRRRQHAVLRPGGGRGRRGRDRPDGDGGGLRQGAAARRRAVRLQQVRHHVEVRLVGEGAPLPRRHRNADAGEEITRAQVRPEPQEALSRERRGLEAALQILLVTRGALPLVDRAPRRRLGRRVDPVPRRLGGARRSHAQGRGHRGQPAPRRPSPPSASVH